MNPQILIMALLAIASAGALPMRALAVGGAHPRAVAVLAEDKNPVNALAKIIKESRLQEVQESAPIIAFGAAAATA